MLEFIWGDFLYKPIFNLLIILYEYNNAFNLGLAVIYLTVIFRILLLPFTFFAQRNKVRYEMLSNEVEKIKEDYRHDPEQAKTEVRRSMKKYKIRPWAKAIVLGVQGVVLIVLYQVFMGGINNKFDALYPSIATPDFVQLSFMGINLAEKNVLLSVVVGVILFFEIFFFQRKMKNMLTKSDIVFRYFFPLFSAIFLSILPSVKSIFILTSILFTIIVSLVLRLFISPIKGNNKKSK